MDGKDGVNGVDGTQWYADSTDIQYVTFGANGDYYYDTDDYKLYRKESGEWRLLVNDFGKPGTNGTDGEDGQDGIAGTVWFTGEEISGTDSGIAAVVKGAKVGDLYLNTKTACVYKCVKNGEWEYLMNLSMTANVGKQDWEEDGTLKIMSIGNSFSVDSQEYCYQIAQSLGINRVILGNLYIGGCSLSIHLDNAKNNKAAYTYYTNSDGTWKTTDGYTIEDAVLSENWDYITFQQASGLSGDASSYADLNQLIDIVESLRPKAKLVWNMTWAYQGDSNHGDFGKYGNDQTIMYEAIIDSVKKKIDTNEAVDRVIPIGTAIQNARTSYLGDNLTRDGYHLTYDVGRYIAGLCFVRSMTGMDIKNISYAPSGVSAELKKIAIESVNNAFVKPYEVTLSAYTNESDSIQTIKYDENELCDYYAVSSTNGLAVAANDYSITSFINCKDAIDIYLTMVQSTLTDIGIAFYDENKTFISGVSAPTGNNAASYETVTVPQNAAYFRTSYFGYSVRAAVDKFVCDVRYSPFKKLNKYREYQSGFIYFNQEVNQSLNENAQSDYKATTGVLALPESYSAEGKATPVIIYAHGYSHYVYYDHWGSTAAFEKQKKYFVEQGFAVLGCNGARDNNKKGQFPSCGAPQYARAYKQCLDYALENYNLDANNVFIVGGSAGGPTAIDLAVTYRGSFKGLILIAAWTDIYDHAWGQNVRSNFVEYLGFENTSVYENEKADKYNPYKLMKTDGDGNDYIDAFDIPVYGLYGSKDTGIYISKFKKFISAVNNGNFYDCELFEFNGYGHEIVSGEVEIVDKKICELCKALIVM